MADHLITCTHIERDHSHEAACGSAGVSSGLESIAESMRDQPLARSAWRSRRCLSFPNTCMLGLELSGNTYRLARIIIPVFRGRWPHGLACCLPACLPAFPSLRDSAQSLHCLLSFFSWSMGTSTGSFLLHRPTSPLNTSPLKRLGPAGKYAPIDVAYHLREIRFKTKKITKRPI